MSADLGRDKTPARISGMFDAIAHRYDLLNAVLSAGLDRRWRRRAIRALHLSDDATVLDLCTGTADLAFAALATGDRRRVIGLDFARRMLERAAEKRGRHAGGTRLALVQGDATRLPLARDSVDAAMVAFGIRNVARPQDTFADVHRCLVPGGRFVILEFGLPQTPIVRPLYLWYFRHVLPRVGRLVSGHASAYEYLPASVGTFQPPAALTAQLRSAGFIDVTADHLSLGIVYLYSARKPVLP